MEDTIGPKRIALLALILSGACGNGHKGFDPHEAD